MQINNQILNYALTTPGLFYTEEVNGNFYVYFDDETQDSENSIKIEDNEDHMTIYTTSNHDFNNGLGFMSNLCMTTDKDCANMICDALNSLKTIYTKRIE